MSDDSKRPEDVVLLHSPTPDGEGARVLRFREERVELGEVRPLKEGKPLPSSGEVVSLRPRKEAPFVCDVEVGYRREQAASSAAPAARTARVGPAQVSSPNYRANWDAIFGGVQAHDDSEPRLRSAAPGTDLPN